MKHCLSVILALALCLALTVPAAALRLIDIEDQPVFEENIAQQLDRGNPFRDVLTVDYYHDAVVWAYIFGVTTGTSETTFAPGMTCTRGQVVTFLWRACGEPMPESMKNPFTDVHEKDFYYIPVLWAVEQGITLGTSATTFSPEVKCSYAQILTFLHRSLGSPAAASDEGKYAGTYYAQAVAWGNDFRMYDALSVPLDPEADCPRCDVVQFLYSVLGNGFKPSL